MPFLIFLSTFVIYLTTLYPAIAPEDSGEFVSAVWTYGIPHATGYPVYILMGKIVSFLVPFGNPAYRVNILSALLGASIVTIMGFVIRGFVLNRPWMYDAVTDMEERRWMDISSWTGSMLLAFVPVYWYLSLIAEVYILNAFFAVLILFVILYREKFDKLYIFSFLFGFALCNHHTLVLWLPGFLWLTYISVKPVKFTRPVSFLYSEDRDSSVLNAIISDRRRIFLWSVLFFLIGMSLYAFIYIRSNAHPSVDTGDPGSIGRFWRVLTRSDYGTFSLSRATPEESAGKGRSASMVFYLRMILNSFTPAGIVLIFAGTWFLYKRSREIFGIVTLFWLFSGPIFILLANPPSNLYFQGVIERFFVLSFIPLSIIVSVGIYHLGSKKTSIRPLFLLLVPAALLLNMKSVTGRGNLHARDFGLNLLKSMPVGSIMYNPGDSAAYSMLYQQEVLNNRRDVKLIMYHKTLWGQQLLREKYPDIFPEKISGYDPVFLPRLLTQMKTNLLFVEVPRSLPGISSEDKLSSKTGYPEDGLPFGIAYRFFPRDKYGLVSPEAQLSLCELPFWWFRTSAELKSIRYRHDPFTRSIVNRYAEAWSNIGQKYAQYALYEKAKEKYVAALSIDPDLMEAHNNRGVAEYSQGNYSKASKDFVMAAELKPYRADLRNNLAVSYAKAGEIPKAEEAYRKALELSPSFSKARLGLAQLLFESKRYAESLEEWLWIEKNDPGSGGYALYMAKAYNELGKKKEALKYVESYIDSAGDIESLLEAKQLRKRLISDTGDGT